jgi:hypothetical protein
MDRDVGLLHVVVLKAEPDTRLADIQTLIDVSPAQLTKSEGVRGLSAGILATGATHDTTRAKPRRQCWCSTTRPG